MRAFRFHGKNDVRLDRVEIPKCGPGQVKIRPAFVGICGTDVHEYTRGATLIPTTTHPLTGRKPPLTLGHEFSGVIVEVGAGVKGLGADDKVVVQPIIPDGTCGPCREGRINICRGQGVVGLKADGGLADFVVVAASNVFKLPQKISLEIGALVEPLSVSWHAVRLSPFKAGDTALVLGGGPIGQGIIQALKIHGAKTIIVSEISTLRKTMAREFGADHVLDPSQDNIVRRCRDICNKEGVHVAYDTVGIQESLDQAVKAARAGGCVMNVAVWGGAASLRPNDLVLSERSIMGTSVYVDADFQEVIDALESGTLRPEKMITAKIQLERVLEDGINALIHNSANQVKILVDIGQKSTSAHL